MASTGSPITQQQIGKHIEQNVFALFGAVIRILLQNPRKPTKTSHRKRVNRNADAKLLQQFITFSSQNVLPSSIKLSFETFFTPTYNRSVALKYLPKRTCILI